MKKIYFILSFANITAIVKTYSDKKYIWWNVNFFNLKKSNPFFLKDIS